jgi:hypothetical protein
VEVLPTSTYNVSPDVTDAVTLAVPPFPPAVSESLAPDAPTADICTLDTPVGTSNVCSASVPENEHVTVPPDTKQFDGSDAAADPASANPHNANNPAVTPNNTAPKRCGRRKERSQTMKPSLSQPSSLKAQELINRRRC